MASRVALATVLGAIGALPLAAPALRAEEVTAVSTRPHQVSVVDGRVTLDIEGVPLSAVLSEIARATGATIQVRGATGHLVTAAFTDLPLDRAIQRLAHGSQGVVIEFEETRDQGPRLLAASITVDTSAGAQRVDSPSRAQRLNPSRAGAEVNEAAQDRSSLAPEEQLRSGSPEDVLMGASRLYPALRGVDAIYAAATHADPQIRAHALTALAEVGSGDRLRQTLEQAANDPDTAVSQLASRMLGRPTLRDVGAPRAPRRR